jgi:DNA invertase Pin-like site-specific DNA recombinase
MKAVIYMRVSTKEQTTDNQLLDLEKVIALKKWQVVGKPLIDHGISGAKGRDKRPALDKALLMCAKRECDILVVWALDRLGRSLQDLLNILN